MKNEKKRQRTEERKYIRRKKIVKAETRKTKRVKNTKSKRDIY